MDPFDLTPAEFEEEVRRILEEEELALTDFRTCHLEKIRGPDGGYVFDVTARFEALGASFLVLVECKRQRKPVEREAVQLLHDKLRAVGAHKGMVFSTARFQSGAIEYAQAHGIALVLVKDGRLCYQTKARGGAVEYPPWIPRTVGTLVSLTDDGSERHSSLGAIGPPEWHPKSEGYLRGYLRV